MEKIYTIPVNEAFDAVIEDNGKGCPFCEMRHKVEENELELILGASMMEPDVRIKTNEQGFCHRHFSMMLKRKNRLALALMLESHLAQVDKISKGLFASKNMQKLEKNCYICGKVDYHMERMIETAVYLYGEDRAFENKVKSAPYYCLEHYNALSAAAKDGLKKSQCSDLQKDIYNVNKKYLDELKNDISWFCKKFDYRYEEEPWGNAKDSPERTLDFLCGKDYNDKE